MPTRPVFVPHALADEKYIVQNKKSGKFVRTSYAFITSFVKHLNNCAS